MSIDKLEQALSSIPEGLRTPLIQQFEEGLAEYRAGDWEKVGLKAGKFCETAFTICEGHANGTFAASPSKPPNMFDDCKKLEAHNKTKGRSLCIQIPRILIGLYELRNNRAIGHIGGDVDPNHMDAEFYLRGMKWVLAEFIRFFSTLSIDESLAVVEAVTARTFPIVWKDGDVRRILDPQKSIDDKVLILLYSENSAVSVSELFKWSGHSNITRFKNTNLTKLDKKSLIHFDKKKNTVQILPPGQRYVEDTGLLELQLKMLV